MNPWKVFVKGSRFVLQLALIIIFLYFFGMPAIKRYLAREVMVVKTFRKSGGKIAAPSITINTRNPKTSKGWRGEDSNSEKYLEACLQSSDPEACVDNETYSQSDVFSDVLLGYSKKLSLMNLTNMWRKDYQSYRLGSILTFNFPLSVGPNIFNDRLIFELSYALTYRFFIHDPRYFVITWNNAYFPVSFLSISPNKTNNFVVKFDLVEVMKMLYSTFLCMHDVYQVEELDIPEDKCDMDKNYNFHGCVRKSLSRQVRKGDDESFDFTQVGCRSKWDVWSETDVDLTLSWILLRKCDSMREHSFLKIYPAPSS